MKINGLSFYIPNYLNYQSHFSYTKYMRGEGQVTLKYRQAFINKRLSKNALSNTVPKKLQGSSKEEKLLLVKKRKEENIVMFLST